MSESKSRGDTYNKCLAWGIDFYEPDDHKFWTQFDRAARIVDTFRYHQPSQEQIDDISAVRRGAIDFAELALRRTTVGADQTHALRLIHEAMMTLNKSIVCEAPR